MHDPNVQDLGICSVVDNGHERWMGTSPKLSVSDTVGFYTQSVVKSGFCVFFSKFLGLLLLCLSQ